MKVIGNNTSLTLNFCTYCCAHQYSQQSHWYQRFN